MIGSYILLAISILTENLAASVLTATKGFTKLKPSLICIVSYLICFGTFGIALLQINLGVAYATWGAVGMVFTTVAGYLLYNQKLTKIGFASLILIIVSIVILNLFA